VVLDDAFGNAATDIYAYAAAGISKSRTWIIGPHGGEEGTINPGTSWQAVTNALDAQAAVAQPFSFLPAAKRDSATGSKPIGAVRPRYRECRSRVCRRVRRSHRLRLGGSPACARRAS